ncbi:MAG: ATP-binding cassette domain-containing protein [Acidimicrobiia bacterium]|nr:ATP-binding cassette domain-containing protein [Acidimicrobiia bacterium]
MLSMIDVRDLAKRFGSLEAVRYVSFQVAKGEVFGLLGPNGAGKTTTISMMSTLLRPTAGFATLDGFDVVNDRSEVRRSIGLVFQLPTLDESLTAEQNLRFHAFAYGMKAEERNAQIDRMLTLVELWDRRKDTVRDFSGGMRRRLEIARGLLHNPKVLFLDEPTLGLDPQTRRRIWDYLHQLRDGHDLTIVLTTHYMDEAENCDRIAVIDEGRIVALDTPDQLKAQVGGDLVTLTSPDPSSAAEEIRSRFGLTPTIQEKTVRFQVPGGEAFLPGFIRSFSQPLEAIGLRRPTLDDVFLHLTGREIRDGDHVGGAQQSPSRRYGR